MSNRILGAAVSACVVLGSCTGKGEKTLVPMPGQGQLPQVYVFQPPTAELIKAEAGLLLFPPKDILESTLNARVEFVILRGTVAEQSRLLRTYYARPSTMTILLGAAAQAAFFAAVPPREDVRKIFFIGESSERLDTKRVDDPNWYRVRVDTKAIRKFAERVCASSVVSHCTWVDAGGVGAEIPGSSLAVGGTAKSAASSAPLPSASRVALQLRMGRSSDLQQEILKKPFVEYRVAWEKLLLSYLDSKAAIFLGKVQRVHPGSGFFEYLLDPSIAANGVAKTELEKVLAAGKLDALRGEL